eukprot:3536776-Pyramimonas_sp.AAC.3
MFCTASTPSTSIDPCRSNAGAGEEWLQEGDVSFFTGDGPSELGEQRYVAHPTNPNNKNPIETLSTSER